MPKGLSISADDKILLYLMNFGCQDEVYECDSGLTQKGVAVNVRIQRKHISRYLDKLVEVGLVEEGARRVKGAKQKMRCYWLSPSGMARAREIRDSVLGLTVRVKVNGDTREMRISEIDGATSVHLRLSDIVCEAMDAGDILDMDVLEKIEERNRRMMDEKTAKNEVYRRALSVAWRSGILTSSEKHLIDALRTHLGITDEEHRDMETVVLNNIPDMNATHADLYDEILNILGGEPTEREEEILELLRDRLAKRNGK